MRVEPNVAYSIAYAHHGNLHTESSDNRSKPNVVVCDKHVQRASEATSNYRYLMIRHDFHSPTYLV